MSSQSRYQKVSGAEQEQDQGIGAEFLEHEPLTWDPTTTTPEITSSIATSPIIPRKPVQSTSYDSPRVTEEDVTNASYFDQQRLVEDQPPVPVHERYFGQHDSTVFTWLPYTLRSPYLFSVFLLSVALGLAVIILAWVSSSRDGLGDDNGTSILLFGWRFTPTLVVVLFTVMEILLLNDARRTEVFARLSQHSGSNASSTILKVPGRWWNDPFNALSRRKNGGQRSYVIFYVAVMNILGSFILSPLSAAFLSSEPTQISRSVSFATLPSISAIKAGVSPNDQIYLSSVSALVLNLTTSVWLTDDYAIVPFWPSELSKPPLGATVPVTAQNWTANTTIFKAELSCKPLSMTNLQKTTFQLSSDDGCSLGVTVAALIDVNDASIPSAQALAAASPSENSMSTDAAIDHQFFFPILNQGSWWVPTSITPDEFSTQQFWQGFNETALVNVSSQCQNRYILAVNTQFNITWNSYDTGGPVNDSKITSDMSSFSINSYICSTRYVMANLEATLSKSSSNTSITFDQSAFNKSKVDMRPTDLNITSFESGFFNNTWAMKLNTSNYGTWMGPSAVLGAKYAYNYQEMMSDPLLISKAQQVQQRFLGEFLLAGFSKSAAQGSQSRKGTTTITKERIVAGFGVGITMGIIFLLISMMVVLVFYHSRLSRRPLNLDRDPGSAAAMSSLLKLVETRSYFQGLDRLPEPLIRRRLENLYFELEAKGLIVHDVGHLGAAPQPLHTLSSHAYSKDWRPIVLRGWAGCALVFTITLLMVALSALIAMSESHGLYQAGLVYQFSIPFKSGYITSLAPYSIIPTLIAVGARFWWQALEETFKRLQPYVSMTKRPVPMSAGPALSYHSSPPIWSVWKAVHMRHWLLALICLGTILSEVFTVGMSALFQRSSSSRPSNITLSRNVKLRDIPEIFLTPEPSDPDSGDPATANILNQLYGESEVLLSWLYGAVIELSYAGSRLPWTYDDWNFAPVSLNSSIPRHSSPPAAPNDASNVTLDTFALRGRLECTPLDMSNQSHWLTSWDLTNGSSWDFSLVTKEERKYHRGYELNVTFFTGMGNQSGDGIWSTFFANPSRVRCCANDTGGAPGLSALGYWAPVGSGFDVSGAQGHGAQDGVFFKSDQTIFTNFTVSWVVGYPFPDQWGEVWKEGNQTMDGNMSIPHYLWSEVPEVVALNCAPIIESSDATVTLQLEDEQVVEYNISTPPSIYEPAWSDYYLHHNNSGENGSDIAYNLSDNVTVSFGYLFIDALLGAADFARVQSTLRWGYGDEWVIDRIFAMRMPGFNADLMSYATWSNLEGNYSALLDPAQLAETSNTVFATFFQHFVSENSASGGGRAYMPINYTLPADFLPIVNGTTGNVTEYQDKNSSTTVSSTVSAILTRPVYRLEMSKIAVGLCLCILLFLGITTLLIFVGYSNYFKALPRDVDTLASVIAMVYDSPKLLRWVAEHGNSGEYNPVQELVEARAMIGNFRGTDGDLRWGIELVEEDSGLRDSVSKKSYSTQEYELLERPTTEVDSR